MINILFGLMDWIFSMIEINMILLFCLKNNGRVFCKVPMGILRKIKMVTIL